MTSFWVLLTTIIIYCGFYSKTLDLMMAFTDKMVTSSQLVVVDRPMKTNDYMLKPLNEFIIYGFRDHAFLPNIIYLSPQRIVRK